MMCPFSPKDTETYPLLGAIQLLNHLKKTLTPIKQYILFEKNHIKDL